MQRLHETDVFLRPEGTATRICRLGDGRIVEGSRVAVPASGPVALSGDGFVAAITGKRRRLWTALLTPELQAMRAGSTRLPLGVRAHSVALLGHRLFVGGTCDRETWVGEADVRQPVMADEEPDFRTLALPENINVAHKPIDDLLVYGNRLFAVDDIVTPKWLLVYDLARGGRAALAHHQVIRHYGTYEVIRHAAADSGWLAFLRMSASTLGGCRHVGIHSSGQLREVAGLYFELRRDGTSVIRATGFNPDTDSRLPQDFELSDLFPPGFLPSQIVLVTGQLYFLGVKGEVVGLDLGALSHAQVASWHRIEDRIRVHNLQGLAHRRASLLVAVPLRDRVVAADGWGSAVVLGGGL